LPNSALRILERNFIAGGPVENSNGSDPANATMRISRWKFVGPAQLAGWQILILYLFYWFDTIRL
jgi:hypothetical protein